MTRVREIRRDEWGRYFQRELGEWVRLPPDEEDQRRLEYNQQCERRDQQSAERRRHLVLSTLIAMAVTVAVVIGARLRILEEGG